MVMTDKLDCGYDTSSSLQEFVVGASTDAAGDGTKPNGCNSQRMGPFWGSPD
jgi:hypothetical protein